MSDTTAAQRMKRMRKRQARNELIATVEMPYSLTVSLIESGYLSDEDSFDPIKRGMALARWALSMLKGQ